MDTVKVLEQFIDESEKNHRYSKNVAHGIRTAVRMFGAILNSGEKLSIDKFKTNLDEISVRLLSSEGSDINTNSISTYKSRINRLVRDYEIFTGKVQSKKITETRVSKTKLLATQVTKMHHIELALRTDSRFTLIFPRDITVNESRIIKSLIDSLVSRHEKTKSK
jgi:hypothetical protein